MKTQVLFIPVLSILIIQANCGVVDRVYEGAVGAVDTTKEAIGGMFSFGKELVFGKNDPYPDKDTGRHNDGIIGGFMNTVHDGAGYVRTGVSKVMDYEHSLRQKIFGVFKPSNKGTGVEQTTQNIQNNQDKEQQPAYHHGEGLLDVRMANNIGKDLKKNENNNRDYITGINGGIYDKVDDGYNNFKDNINEYSNNAIDNVRKAKSNIDENIDVAKNQLNKNIDRLKDDTKKQMENVQKNFKDTVDKENEMVSTVPKKINGDSIVFGDLVRNDGSSIAKLPYGGY